MAADDNITEKNPDTELVELGGEFRLLVDAACDADDPEELHSRLDAIVDRIDVIEPQTMAGIGVKLRVLWCRYMEDLTEYRYGAQPGSDVRTKSFWRFIQQVEAMSQAAATSPFHGIGSQG